MSSMDPPFPFCLDIPAGLPSIQCLFSAKYILITGATGFVGKVLVEKLLRSCPAICRIYVLIRGNAKSSSSQRFQKLLESSVFDRLKAEHPDSLRLMSVVEGDITEVDLKLNPEDLGTITSSVQFVFHCAASVRFENDTKNTLDINLLGVKNVLNLCHKITKLEALVHVSTAYSFCDQEVIDEKVYNETMKVEELEDLISCMTPAQLKECCASLSQSRPSLYQYSKAMAEILINETCSNLPVIIVRPSIITAAIEEPFPGWIDNYNGPSGFIALSSKGILKTLLVKTDVNADWVPVDLVANTLIVAAHHIALTRRYPTEIEPLKKASQVPIVNCICPQTNSIKWYKIAKTCIPLLHKYPSLEVYRVPGGIITTCPYFHEILKFTFHYLPAVVMDFGMLLMGRRRRFVNDYRRIHKVQDFLQLYTMHKFNFKCDNMIQLTEKIGSQDVSLFPINQNNLEWPKYLETYVHGVRKYFLKEDDSTLPQARKKVFKFQCLYYCVKWIPICILVLLMVKRRTQLNFMPPSFRKPLYKNGFNFVRINNCFSL